MKINQQGIVPLLLIGLLALAIGGGAGTVYAVNHSLPGDFLYPAKQQLSNLQLLIALTPEDKASVRLKIADKKLKEIEKLQVKNASAEKIHQSADALTKDTDLVEAEVENLQTEGKNVTSLLERLRDNLERQQVVLERVAQQVSSTAKAHIEDAITVSQRGLTKAIQQQQKINKN